MDEIMNSITYGNTFIGRSSGKIPPNVYVLAKLGISVNGATRVTPLGRIPIK